MLWAARDHGALNITPLARSARSRLASWPAAHRQASISFASMHSSLLVWQCAAKSARSNKTVPTQPTRSRGIRRASGREVPIPCGRKPRKRPAPSRTHARRATYIGRERGFLYIERPKLLVGRDLMGQEKTAENRNYRAGFTREAVAQGDLARSDGGFGGFLRFSHSSTQPDLGFVLVGTVRKAIRCCLLSASVTLS